MQQVRQRRDWAEGLRGGRVLWFQAFIGLGLLMIVGFRVWGLWFRV